MALSTAILSLSLPLFLLLLASATPSAHLTSSPLDLVRKRPGLPVDSFRLSAPNGRSIGGSDGHGTRDELLDMVLLATVDGKFHALNRTSGVILWSMHDGLQEPTQDSEDMAGDNLSTVESALAPLVRTIHPPIEGRDYEGWRDEEGDDELYIVEPQSGDIYVLPSSSSSSTPISKLAFSVPELVEMSPFMFPGDDSRVFVGKKETSLLVLELETGRVRGVVNPDRECPWDVPSAKDDWSGRLFDDAEVDLDELDGTKERERGYREIYIGRTDYRIQIRNKPSNSHSGSTHTQTLLYSAYGPNNIDRHRQSNYKHTEDDLYVQSLPDGDVFAFVSKGIDSDDDKEGEVRNLLKWGIKLGETVVATFDVLQNPTQPNPNPYILLQPRPHISQILRQRPRSPSSDIPIGDERAYVGIVDGSLYVLGSEAYPLVLFGDGKQGGRPRHTGLIDGADASAIPPDNGKQDFYEEQKCGSIECLSGFRMTDSSRRREHFLIDGPVRDVIYQIGQEISSNESGADGEADTAKATMRPTPQSLVGRGWGMRSLGALATLLLASVGALWIWMRTMRHEVASVDNPSHVVANGHASPKPKHVRFNSTWDAQASEVTDLNTDSHSSADQIPEPILISPASVQEAVYVSKEHDDESPHLSNVVVLPSIPSTPSSTAQLEDEGLNDPDDDEVANGDKKRKNRMRSRAKKRKAANAREAEEKAMEKEKEKEREMAELAIDKVEIEIEADKRVEVKSVNSLVVSEEVLGFGSHGTMVFKGSFQGRAVAIKRLLTDFVTLASREVTLLQESDEHPNVIRYYFQEARNNFLYIALELCPASLADVIERPDNPRYNEISCSFDPKRALMQITSGLRWLHSLKIVHRDIKPQNILVAYSKGLTPIRSTSTAGSTPGKAQHRMLISDFGLCKKLDVDETSFLPTLHGAMAAGTVGWRAPEILRGDVKLDDSSLPSDENSQSSRGSAANGSSGVNGNKNRTRLTKSVDVFALGCLFYYTLTSGGHPYGNRYEWEINIMKDVKDLSTLEAFGEEGVEAIDLIGKMLHPESSSRPDTTTILLHPFFWTPARRLTFLQDASDRFEVMNRDPREEPLVILEKDARQVVGNDWHSRLDRTFIENLGKFRKYDGKSVQDLLRALRNKKHHYQDLPEHVKRHLGPLPDGFLAYFTRRYPALFLHVYYAVSASGLARESMFRSYFELTDG